MTDSCTDRYDKILEDYLGEENLKQCKKLGLTENRLMSLYHKEFDRDQEAFREGVERMLASESVREMDRLVKQQIDSLTREIEQLQGLRIGMAEDWIKGEKGDTE